ncbi:hypothetical protein X975_20525, partial [Stegodyphus mimosarum]
MNVLPLFTEIATNKLTKNVHSLVGHSSVVIPSSVTASSTSTSFYNRRNSYISQNSFCSIKWNIFSSNSCVCSYNGWS